MYNFVVDLVGVVPTEFSFIYTILTLVFSICILATFTHFFYFFFNLVKGGN